MFVTNVGHASLADSTTNPLAIGLAYEDVSAGAGGSYITEGQIQKTDWSDVTGDAHLLPGEVYYLSTVGKLSTTAPSAAGDSVCRVGIASATDTLDIEIARPIKLSGNTSTGGDTEHMVDASSGPQTISLPPAADMEGQKVNIKKIDSTSNYVTIDADGSETIDDQLTQVLTDPYTSITVLSDGTEWFII